MRALAPLMLVIGLFVAGGGATPALAQAQCPWPEGVALVVRGAGLPPEGARFSVAALEALGLSDLTTGTPWDEGPVQWEGVRLSALLRQVGAKGTSLQLTALNDYSAELPLSDVRSYEPLLATRRNGKPMAVRDKGPVFVIYPFDQHKELRNEEIYGRNVWQLCLIEVR